MSYDSAPFWWITCDAPDCKAKSTESGGDYAAWCDQDGAWVEADATGWIRSEDDSKHYCDEHRRYVCGECDKSEGREYPLDHEGMCDECWAEDAKQNHGIRVAP